MNEKSRDAKVELWVTPQHKKFVWEKKPFIDTYCFLLIRKGPKQSFSLLLIPWWFNISSRITWLTVSKLFSKSMKTLHTILSLSRDFFIVSMKVGLSTSKTLLLIFFNVNPIKMIKHAFYFVLKTLLIFGIFTSLSWNFIYLRKWRDKKAMVKFKIYNVTDWTADSYNTQILQCLKKYWQPHYEIGPVNRI